MQKTGFSSPEDGEDRKDALPLKAIKVLDLSRLLAGPWATMSLADLGAEVWKIENIEGGDDTRAWVTPNYRGVSAYCLCANRGNPIARNMHDPDVLLPSVGGADALKGCRTPDLPARRAPGPVPSKARLRRASRRHGAKTAFSYRGLIGLFDWLGRKNSIFRPTSLRLRLDGLSQSPKSRSAEEDTDDANDPSDPRDGKEVVLARLRDMRSRTFRSTTRSSIC